MALAPRVEREVNVKATNSRGQQKSVHNICPLLHLLRSLHFLVSRELSGGCRNVIGQHRIRRVASDALPLEQAKS
jgi:hypothetical protein